MGRSLRTPSQSDDLPDPSLAVAGDDYFLAAAGDDSSLAAAGDDSFLAATGDDSSLAEAGGDSALPDVPSIYRDLMSTAHRACKKADAADAQRDKERKEPNFEHKRRPPPPPTTSAARRRNLPPLRLLASRSRPPSIWTTSERPRWKSTARLQSDSEHPIATSPSHP